MIKLISNTFYKEKDTKNKLAKFITSNNYLTFLSFGKECLQFEEDFAKYQGRKYSVFFNSGSTANFALIQALKNLGKFSDSDNIAFSSLTWSTNIMPLLQLNLRPLPVDVEVDSLNISSEMFSSFLKKHSVKGLFITNLLGFSSDIDKIAKICKSKKIILIEDNCESLGSVYKGKKLGNYGLASTFSFYVGHHMSTIEGGSVCTDDKELATMLKIVRAHGWDRNLPKEDQETIRKKYKVSSSFYAQYTFYDLGSNFRPTEINGFLGNNQLKYLPEIISIRNKNFLKLAEVIYSNTEKYIPVKYSHMDFLSNFAFPVICQTKKIKDELVKRCEGKLEIRPIVGGNITVQPFYKKYIKGTSIRNPNAEFIHEHGLYFSNKPELTQKEMSEIVKIFG